jgi:hypothetical protein
VEVARVWFLPVPFCLRHNMKQTIIKLLQNMFLAAFLKYQSQIKVSKKNTSSYSSSSISSIYLTYPLR